MTGARRSLSVVLAVAAAVRVGVLLYDLVANPAPTWSAVAQDQLSIARWILGVGGFTPRFDDDYGLAYVHAVLAAWDGSPSFARLQVAQTALDVGATAVAWRAGLLLGGLPVASLAGALYAVFLPQVAMAVAPSYDAWATWGMIATTWLILEALRPPVREPRASVFGFLGGVAGATCGVVRSSVILLGPFAAAVTLVLGLAGRRLRLGIPVGIAIGWAAVAVLPALHNRALFGELRLIRGTSGHTFWLGVGQFPNPYGLEEFDTSVEAFYRTLPGAAAPYASEGYDRVLRAAAAAYAREHPAALAWNAVRRALRIVWSAKYWGIWVDTWSPSYRPFSQLVSDAGGLQTAVIRWPLRAALVVLGRAVDLVILPVGLAAAFIRWRRPEVWIAVLPVLYTVVTLAPLFFTPRNTASAYAAALPACAYGLLLLRDWLRRQQEDRRGVSAAF